MYSANSTLAGYDGAHSSRLHNFVVHLCVHLRAAVYHWWNGYEGHCCIGQHQDLKRWHFGRTLLNLNSVWSRLEQKYNKIKDLLHIQNAFQIKYLI